MSQLPLDQIASFGSLANPNSWELGAAGSGPMATPSWYRPDGAAAGGGLGAFGIANLALGGIGTIGNLLASFGALKLAKQQFKFQKEFSTKNMANQIQSYNTALADRGRSRAAMEGQSSEQAQAYIDQNRLKPMGG